MTVRMSGPWRLLLPALLGAGFLGGCSTPELFAPDPKDPLDGYEGSLAEAGVNTEMDWGPGQGLLLGEYKNVQEENARLRARLEELAADSKRLTASLDSEREALELEKSRRAQAEAEADQLRVARRELEARVLGLSIEKAKLEQSTLLGRIAELQRSLDKMTAPDPQDAAAAPPGRER